MAPEKATATTNVAATGLGIRYSGSGYWGGWSGDITLPVSTDVVLLDFTSPNINLLTEVMFSANLKNSSAGDIQFKITLNGEIVYNVYETAAIDRGGNLGTFPNPKLIIPPSTVVQIVMRQDENVVVTSAALLIATEL